MAMNAAEDSSAIDDRVRVASAVRAHYAAAGFSASALAREIGMSQSKMSRRTTAAEPFDIDELSAIAHVLEIDLADLITGHNLPTRPLRASGPAAGKRGLYLLDNVGPAGFEPTTTWVESRQSADEAEPVHLATVTDIFGRQEVAS